MLIIIAALGKNKEIGANNKLLWYLLSDLKFFKEMTINHKIVMGRRTFESLPKLLPGRKHIIISKNGIDFPDEVIVCRSVNEFLDTYNKPEDIFVIGGESIYQELIDYTDKMYLTEINEGYPLADKYFPNFEINDWNKEVLDTKEDNGVQYTHTLYSRK